MSHAVEAKVASQRVPLPTHFSLAEQSFSLKKRRPAISTSSTSTSPYSTQTRLSHSLPPQPPSKGCPSLNRMLRQQPFTPLSQSLSKSPPPNDVHDPNKQQTYFTQCFTNLGLLGRGSFGEVYKVQSNKDGRKYAIKRSTNRYRGNTERARSIREANNHERLCPHPHILNFVAAWEECGRLYIQTELCSRSLLLHAENQPPGPDEPAARAYLCDLLLALEHLHSHGFVHLDLKPANVLITESGRLKLGDFGLLLKFKQMDGEQEIHQVKEDIQEGDAKYMAPELLRGEYGPAADVFSLGVTMLELACNIEIPNGGDGWQQLREGCLPSEIISGLSSDFQTVLQMMLAPEPSERPTVSELLSLSCVRKWRWKRCIYLMITETMLTLASLCQVTLGFGWKILSFHRSFLPISSKLVPSTPPKGSWDKDLTLPLSVMIAESGTPDESVFLMDPIDPGLSPLSHRLKLRMSLESTSTPFPGSGSPAGTPTHLRKWNSCNLALSPSAIHLNGSCHTLTPNASPIHSASMSKVSRLSPQTSPVGDDEILLRHNLEPKNLLSLFEETAVEDTH